MSILLMLHSIVRWIIVLVAVVAIVKLTPPPSRVAERRQL